MIDMLEKEPLNQSAESSKERIPENYQLRYFTEMEVAGLMGFPKCFSFPSELTTRQVCSIWTPDVAIDPGPAIRKLNSVALFMKSL